MNWIPNWFNRWMYRHEKTGVYCRVCQTELPYPARFDGDHLPATWFCWKCSRRVPDWVIFDQLVENPDIMRFWVAEDFRVKREQHERAKDIKE
jgi:hypothetical protein